MQKNRNELVRLTTQDISKAIPITDTGMISDRLNTLKCGKTLKRGDKGFIQLSNLNNLVLKFSQEMEMFGNKTFSEKALNQNTGNYRNVFVLSEQQSTFLISLLDNTNKNVLGLKVELIKKFYSMKNELLARKETRHLGIHARKSLTDSIRDNCIDEGNFKRFAYSNYSKLVYKKVLGVTVKKAKNSMGLTEKDNIRDHLTIDQIEKVQDIESKIATRIEAWKELNLTDKEIYSKIKEII